MSTEDIIGFIGVSIILLAYLLSLINLISIKKFTYIFMNLLGAGIACYSAVLIKYVPFIILEGVWASVSLGALIKLYFKRIFNT